ncbi:MAG: head-tail connector protein [Holosporales bacterium]|nr:head-tail connector protein [Holosporales bacterium]
MNTIIEQSKSPALELSVLKAHLRIAHDHEDDYLKTVINMATEILETNIEKPILKKKYRYVHYNDEFVSSRRITLPVREVRGIISVKELPPVAAVKEPLPDRKNDKVSYRVLNDNDRTIIVTNGSKRPIEIKYAAGMTGNADKIPKDLQFAILQIAKNIYECSEEDVLESKYIKHIVNSHRTLSIN